jgi:hypothetical protein
MRNIKVGWLMNLLHNLLFIKDIVEKTIFISNALGNNNLCYFSILQDFDSEKLGWGYILPQLNSKVYVAQFFQNNFCIIFHGDLEKTILHIQALWI